MILKLQNNWFLSWENIYDKTVNTVPAQVPGNVLGDLLRNNIIKDPYLSDNSDELRSWEFVDWSYETEFTIPEHKDNDKVYLVFDGIDTIAQIFIDGHEIGKTRNMFIPHRFDISKFSTQQQHHLTIKIKSAINYARQFPRSVGTRAQDANFESLYMRKARHSYGWDIAPRLVGAGLWRPVSLEIIKPERWTEWYLYTIRFDQNQAVLRLDWSFETPENSLEHFEAILRLTCGEQIFEQSFTPHFVAGRQEIFLPDPQLWEPAGHGKPKLYDVQLILLKNGQNIAVEKRRFGVRTINLNYSESLNDNGKFIFEVNGKPLFIKGSNWIPVDALHGEHPEYIQKKLECFLDMHCNMVRCWGGGVYEDEEFFDWCDENGLLVWQDFMFACEIPPQDDWYLKDVAQEAECIIKKLRHHPSLALWSGDNECDVVIRGWNPKVPPSYNRITRQVLSEAVRTHDPIRNYLPSSPYVSDRVWQTKASMPEQHLWGDRYDWRSSYYTCNDAIFASEMGYPGTPSAENIYKFIPEAKVSNMLDSTEWNCHAAQQFKDMNGPFSFRIKLLRDLVKKVFAYIPDSLEEFAECSQIIQAEALKSFVESFRLKKWQKSGLIWWNMRDCWPQFSDAVVGYYFDKKLAYHYIKNSQQELCLMIEQPSSWAVNVYAVNDTGSPCNGEFYITDFTSEQLEYKGKYSVDTNSSALVAVIRPEQGISRLLKINWEYNGKNYVNHFLLGSGFIDLNSYRKLSCPIIEQKEYLSS